MKLSIIVPVYNMAGDGKLNFCLDSLVAQTISDYEIIAVNDASTDASISILRQYEGKYPEKFRVVDLPVNRHQGGARNEGIKEATGEWIGFIDSDDWITADYYEKLVKKGEETGADVVGCGYTVVGEHTFNITREIHDITDEQVGVLTDEKRHKFLKNNGSMVMKVYRASLIKDNNLSFPENIFYEDNCAGPVWAMYFKHFEYVREPMYFYYQHDSSTVHTITKERCADRLTAGTMMLDELKKRGFFEKYKTEIESLFTQTYLVNTLFSYMRIRRGKKFSFISQMRTTMLKEFPGFMENPEYGRFMDDEQKSYLVLFMKNPRVFYIKYSLLWFYRDLRYKKKN
ncbi:MAG: glycosyltransferase [Acetatifactor sp.]|nr:glycosyltransferase [Acetatifactor sp.]